MRNVEGDAPVAEAAKIMAAHNISCIVAMKAKKPVGVLTERDLLKRVVALQKDPAQIKMAAVMSAPVKSIPPHYSIFSASRIMEKMNIRRLIIMENNQLRDIVTQTDIFRAVEKKLQAEEEKKVDLLEKSQNAIYTIDLDGKITYVNPAFMKLLELSDLKEVINQPFLPQRFWLNPKERTRFLSRLKAGTLETAELALKNSKGKKIYVTLFSTLTKNIHGQINGSQGILYDITAKKELVALRETEEELRVSEENYRSIFNSANDAIFVHDFDTGAILDCNQKTCEIFGYTAEEILNIDIGTLSSGEPPYTQENALQLLKMVAKGEPQILQWRAKDKSGRLFWVEVNLKAAVISGKKRVLAVLRDITERKQAEEQSNKTLDELRRFNKLAVGRELRMIELKREVNALLRELGHEEAYPTMKMPDPQAAAETIQANTENDRT
jgi:PAS domain S-box-containing protein